MFWKKNLKGNLKVQTKRIKSVISIAILLIVSLLVLSAYLLVTISNKEEKLAKQQDEIARIKNEQKYYKNQQNENRDDKESDVEIIVPEE